MAMTLKEFSRGLGNLQSWGIPAMMNESLNDLSDIVIRTAKPLTRVDTGLLKNSYRRTATTVTGKEWKCRVYNSASRNGETSYARFNELGTKHMAPRLMLTTGGARAFQRAQQVVSKNWRTAFESS